MRTANTKNNPVLVERVRLLRKAMTYEERKLWYLFLAKHYVRWYRQKVTGNFILDFYCAKARLAIELDGNQHYTNQGYGYDLERSSMIAKYGIEVLRFSNKEIRENFDKVCSILDWYVKKRVNT